MKVLLTGASGFVGSHLLDKLRQRNIPTVVLVRSTSNKRFFADHLQWAELRTGSLMDRSGLVAAMEGVTHVIHCAGLTKALNRSEFMTINQVGTRNMVSALPATVTRFIYMSSLAAVGPSLPGTPRTEFDPPCPISDYGKSKLAAEEEVRSGCRAEYVIVRPPGVYGPRDAEFLKMFRSIKNHVLPNPPRQALSLVFVEDLAEAVLVALEHPSAAGKTYFVSHKEVVTAAEMAREIARQMKVWAIRLPIPAPVLWAVCCGAELGSRLTQKPSVVSLQKFPELMAAGWTCSPSLLIEDTGFQCPTPLAEGIRKSLRWYDENGWI